MQSSDFIVIGAGIAGASVAAELSAHGSVSLLEAEDQPGYHSTGRSAATYTEIYGNAAIRALTVASGRFFAAPSEGFDGSLWTPRPLLMIARADQLDALHGLHAEASGLAPNIRILDAGEARSLAPALREDYLAAALLEPDAYDLDVHAIHSGFLRRARVGGAALVRSAEARALTFDGGVWRVDTKAGSFSAPIVVNAAGAWADTIAGLAGVAAAGIQPKRRTAFVFSPRPAREVSGWPMVIDIDEEFYFKPDAGRILGSPADETPTPACDVQPDEFDIAVAIDRICRAADFEIGHVERKWAGLRNFAPDKTPVVGFAKDHPGFFWLAGQGGYGIQTSPALSRLAAALIVDGAVPDDIAALGISAGMLSPSRPALG